MARATQKRGIFKTKNNFKYTHRLRSKVGQMRVYHFLNGEHGLQNIKKRRVKISTLSDINDPFEWLAFSTNADEAFHESWIKVRESFSDRRGMICFSESWNNPVLWSHYGDRHRGLCLGFDVPDNYLNKVIYTHLRVPPDFRNGFQSVEWKALLEQSLRTKYIHWAYEQEWRLWVGLDPDYAEKDLYFYPFSDFISLKEVIIGACSVVPVELIEQALAPMRVSVDLYRAKLSLSAYELHRSAIPLSG